MKYAWKLYEDKRAEFGDTDFTTDDPWQRREARERLFELLDNAIAV